MLRPQDHPTRSAVVPLHTVNIVGDFCCISMFSILEVLIFQPDGGWRTALRGQCAQKQQSFLILFFLS